MVQLLGEGRFRSQRRGQTIDQLDISRQDAVGCGVGQRRQRHAAAAAVMVSAEDEHQVSGQHRRRGLLPDASIDWPAALIVDVGRDEAAAVPRGRRRITVAVAAEKVAKGGRRGRIAEVGQGRRSVGLGAIVDQQRLAARLRALVDQ